jgi:hypothetical protein
MIFSWTVNYAKSQLCIKIAKFVPSLAREYCSKLDTVVGLLTLMTDSRTSKKAPKMPNRRLHGWVPNDGVQCEFTKGGK